MARGKFWLLRNELQRRRDYAGTDDGVPREMESAFATKIRTGEIDSEAAPIARRRLESDLGRRNILKAAVGDEHFEIARRLPIRYGADRSLRTLDALQLSVAAGLRRAGYPPIFVAADRRLCEVAEPEGFQVTNPEHPTLMVNRSRRLRGRCPRVPVLRGSRPSGLYEEPRDVTISFEASRMDSAETGRKGGKARAEKLTKKQFSQRARRRQCTLGEGVR